MKYSNILIVYDYAFVNGGSATVAIQSAIGLKELSKYNVYYFSAVGPVCKELENSEVIVKNLEISDINTGGKIKSIINGIWNSYARKELNKFLNKYNLTCNNTIVHFHGVDKALSGSVIYELRNYKCFYTIHEYSVFCPNGGLYNYKKQCLCNVKPMGLKCILCNCDKRSYLQKVWRLIRQLVKNKVLSSEITYIAISELCEKIARENLLNNKVIKINDVITDYTNQGISLDINEYMYVFVGRVSDEKGADLFCEAIRRTKKNNNGISGVVVGDGNRLNELKDEYNEIEFVGWQNADKVKEYISHARMLIFPSKCYETAGLTVLEALALGTPCIVSNNTAAAGFIHDGLSGILFKHMDCDDLCEKIQLSLDDDTVLNMKKYLKNTYDGSVFLRKKHVEQLLAAYNGE